ncbi:pseudoazurin [Novosphingobium terrae]|uniref:pseudoazurin n=1 Tax=Novosphingobium terrae TaxID=2726189 RepID=UPI001F136B89|nr:pseudoazurin [Novosphingobium terrae]
MSMRLALAAATLGLSLAAMPLTASAKEIVVHMKNTGAEGAMVFEPSFVKAAPGDVIHFEPTDAAHNAESIPSLLPAGASAFKGVMGKDVSVTVSKPGLYGVKCMPHYTMGMVALIQVGKVTPAEIAAAKAVNLPPMAKKRMTPLLDKVK